MYGAGRDAIAGGRHPRGRLCAPLLLSHFLTPYPAVGRIGRQLGVDRAAVGRIRRRLGVDRMAVDGDLVVDRAGGDAIAGGRHPQRRVRAPQEVAPSQRPREGVLSTLIRL